MLTQVELEQKMIARGVIRAHVVASRNEEAGEAARNKYANAIYEEYVLPLAHLIEADRAPKKGRPGAHITMLRPMASDAVAYIAVRIALGALMMDADVTQRNLAHKLGRALHSELVLTLFDDVNPDLYMTLVTDLGRRRSKSQRHRMTVFKLQAKKAGINLPDWQAGHIDIIGVYLLGLLRQLGMVDTADPSFVTTEGVKVAKRKPVPVMLSDTALDIIDKEQHRAELLNPLVGPCVEQPMDWESPVEGGWHTRQMRQRVGLLIHAGAVIRDTVNGHPMPMVLKAVNALQRTRWQINKPILEAITACSRAGITAGGMMAEVYDAPRPERPQWLENDPGRDNRTAYQQTELREWKREMSDWYTKRKLSAAHWGRFRVATQEAQEFAEYPAIYFVYKACSRGRLYPHANGVSPQGSDIQKALLRFADGKPLDTLAAQQWFKIHGANKYGYDKATLMERVQWAEDNAQMIVACADDPVANHAWTEADKPLQFLAWCMEFAEWTRAPTTFLSHLPVSLDGSCNGLQHLSAMLRDPVGGKATNLTPSETMQDIYGEVAAVVARRVAAAEPGTYRDAWLANGVPRSAVKRPVMTTPYGIRKQSVRRYLLSDYIKPENLFKDIGQSQAARWLMDPVWDAISEVVIASRLAMDWLTAAAADIIRNDPDTEGAITWETPSGFLASQTYNKSSSYRIACRLFDGVRLTLNYKAEGDDAEPWLSRHTSGMAPNFIHSMDAAHLHMVASSAIDEGITSLAMIHDDMGTHAADTQRLYTLIREAFVSIYRENDPLSLLQMRYPQIKSEVPSKGSLDIEDVLRSEFFFS